MEYPYYVIPDIEALSSTAGEEKLRLLKRIALLVGDPKALREILGNDSDSISQFCQEQAKTSLSTSDTIDSFLDTFGDPNAAESKEVKEVEELVPLPPPDYDLSSIKTDPLITSDTPTGRNDETSNAIDSFLDPRIEKETEKEMPEKREETPLLSESLARAMIK
ncbi:MAG: hypothetical protein K2H76_09170, partial [Muribaculaceae bacterium]|nr:hypothetical protein [Muribaculaceae bacterium]